MIALIDYGAGNVRSVHKALETVGGEVRMVHEPDSLLTAEKIVLPGHVMWAIKVETGINFQYMAGVKVTKALYPERKGPGHLHRHEEFADVVCTILECGGMLRERP